MTHTPVCSLPKTEAEAESKKSPSYPLVFASEGERVKVVSLHGGCLMRERLLSMGINVDDEILVVHKQENGAVVIEKAGCRYGLGGGMAHKINVIKA
ncbi:FeoA family protein [Desulfobulbus elongatus]|uniref:FeoA family protein n=1 Tax=Desulfobulbus elongatus TaxID=53332 RepID=UPI0006891D6A|nr:FeoA family protein [Desulfobulbus elongatus]